MTKVFPIALPLLLAVLSSVLPVRGGEKEALEIDANLRALHMPFGTVLDPIFESPTSNRVVGYTRCGDSALWTGAYLAAESFRYKATGSAEALDNVRAAFAGLKTLADITGDNRLARCIIPLDSPYAAGIEREEANNTVYRTRDGIWVDNTSRDQIVGAFFGLGVAFDLVDDAKLRSDISSLTTLLIGYISRHQWSPNDDLSNSFLVRPEELQMLLQVARHVNPANTVSGPFIVLPVGTAVSVDVLSNGSYFKFNLDFLTFYNLVKLQDNGANRDAYRTVRRYTASHGNAFFNMVDRALSGPDTTRDAETRVLLDQWLTRARRDFRVDLSNAVALCGSEACQPIPVPQRVTTDFLWQRSPFQVSGGGDGFIEGAGIDYLLPYWMARFYGVLPGSAVQSAAAPISIVAPGSLASWFGSGLSTGFAGATQQPPPFTLAGVTVSVTDAAGVSRPALLTYVSPQQINFIVPEGSAPGAAVVSVSSGQSLSFTIAPVAPGLFSLNGAGTGVAAATAIVVQATNPAVQTAVPVFQCTASGCSALPIALSAGSSTYLTLYGTGIRNRGSLGGVSVSVNGVQAPVLYAGSSPGFAGLDQVNVLLPNGLGGSGAVSVVLTVDGQSSNAVIIQIR